METPQLPPDLERLEQLLAGRERPEPSADLKERVIRSVKAELPRAELPPQHSNGWWAFVAATAACVALLLNFSMSAARASSYDLRLAAEPRDFDASVRQIQEMLPELSDREAMRCAVTLQAGSNLARLPHVATGDPAGRQADLDDYLREGE